MIDKPGATTLLAIAADGGLRRSDDEGITWARISKTGIEGSDTFTALAAHPEYPDRGYAATAAGAAYETANRAKRWTRLDVEGSAAVRSLLSAVSEIARNEAVNE